MNIIVAADKNNGIGRDGALLYRIPEDMAYFRAMTLGHTVIMGHNTLRSLPNGRPLKDRRNIVFSRDARLKIEGAEVVASISELAQRIDAGETAFAIGGERIYALLLDYCKTAYVTRVEAAREADSFFPDLDALKNWRLTSESEPKESGGVRFRFCVYENDAVKPAEIYNSCGYMTEYYKL